MTHEISEEVSLKVFDTLAALLPAKLKANEQTELELAVRTLAAKKLRVVLHVAQPKQHSKLFPRPFNPADVKMKLRKRLKAIDPHVQVVGVVSSFVTAWTVH